LKTDFSSPFMRAEIIKSPGPTEQRFSLSVNSDQANPQSLKPVALTGTTAGEKVVGPLFASTLSYLSSVTVSMDLGGVPTIDVVLTPTLEDARTILDSTLLEYPLSAIEVTLGYSTGSEGRFETPPFQGILQPPEVNFGTDVTITLKGVGTAGYYLAATAKSGVEVKQTRRKHIEDLVKKLGVETDYNEWILDPLAKAALDGEENLSTAGTSFLHLISQIARRCGCWVNTFDGNATKGDNADPFRKLKLISQVKMILQKPLALFTLYDFEFGGFGSSIAGNGIYPILSVSVGEGLSAIFLSGWAKKLRQSSINQTTHESSSAESGPQNATAAGDDSAQTGTNSKSNDASETVPPRPDDDVDQQTGLDQIAGMTSLSNSVGLQIEIETIGIPDVFPGNMYEVRGISRRIDDKYVCHAVKHSMSASGFTTSLTLIQNSQIMVQAILDKISPKATNQNPPIPDAPGTDSQLDMSDGVAVTPTVEGFP